jgi:hypothetical protein
MADTFEITAVVPSSRLDGQRVVDTIEASGFTKPNSISFTVQVDKVGSWKAAVAAKAAAEAAELESVFEL